MAVCWWSFLLVLVLSGLIVQSKAAPRPEHKCIHGSRRLDKLITGVNMREGDRVKRDTREPMRFATHADTTITVDLPADKREMIMNEVMPSDCG